MTGLISGDPISSVTLQALGSDDVEAPPGEVAAAAFSSAFHANPIPRIVAEQMRGQMQWQDEGQALPFAPETPAAAPMLSSDEANRRFGIKGDLTFDAPVSEDTASGLYDQHHAETLRQDVIARRGDSVLSGFAARTGLGFAAGLLDPLNLAAGFIPVAGEARVAGMLENAGGALGRAGVRARIGAVQGAVGQAALEPLNYLLDTQDHEDWTAAQAMRNLAFGTVLGGGLHVVGGAVADQVTGRYANPITQRMEDLGPEAREAVLGGAVAQTVDGRPVDVAPLIDFAEARQAQASLRTWQDQQERILADSSAAQDAARVPGDPDRFAEIDNADQHLSQIRAQADQLRAEIEGTREQGVRAAMDPATADRLGAIETELSGVIPKARRADLENERGLLLEGRGEVDVGGSGDLEAQRSQAQARGLSAALQRTESEVASSEATLERLRAQDAAAQTEAAARRDSADRGSRIQQALIDSRQDVTQALAERTVRQFSRRIGVFLDPGEVSTFAREILGAQPAEASDVIANALNSIAGRSVRADVRAATEAAPAARISGGRGALDGEAAGAARDLVDAARRPAGDPEDAAASRQAQDAGAAAKPVTDGVPDERMAEMESFVKAAREAGALDATDEASLRVADDLTAEGNDLGNAWQQAAACLLRGNA